MKHCPKCSKDKPDTDFHRNAARAGGLDWRCKPCKKLSVSTVSQQRRDAKRYAKAANKNKARNKARSHYGGHIYKCSVLNCELYGNELHHVTYEDALAVVPLCSVHHRMNHELE